MLIPGDALAVEREILALHASLKPYPSQGSHNTSAQAKAKVKTDTPDPKSVQESEAEPGLYPDLGPPAQSLLDFARSSGIQICQVPEDFRSLEQGVLSACTKLEFTPLDAQLLAHAWVAQSIRNGQFDATLWPTHRDDFGLATHDKTKAFNPCPSQLGLYAVLPDSEWIKRMAQAGVRTLQLRFKSDDPYLVEKQIEASVRAVEGSESLLFINDHWQLALKHGAYGVHLGQEDLEVLDADDWAQIRTNGLRLGISTHGYCEMIRADALCPSYVALGAVFPTTLKKMQTPPQGLGRLAAYAALMRMYPLVAIGGITEDDFQSVLKTGVGSIAVVRAIVQSANPELTAKELARAF
jgi:thiamine-phosphate pyrophosphorylase